MLEVAIKKNLGGFSLDVAFEAPSGVTVLFGPSGSGKTSVINAVAGLLQPDQGRIALAGTEVFGPKVAIPSEQRSVGYVFQDARLFPHMTVLQNLRYGGRVDEERLIELLALRPVLDRRPAGLSGGEKQRVALARALMRGPKILLMDEPLAALDDRLKSEILPYIEGLRGALDVPILYVTHDISEVARLATTVVLMANGKVTRYGPAAEVLSDPDAVPMIGVRAAGAIVDAKVVSFDSRDRLTTLEFDGGTLVLPGDLRPSGRALRLRIPAQDVILSREKPSKISALNVLSVKVVKLTHGRGPGVAVGLQCGETPLLARVTARSARVLGLEEGLDLYAILKATAVARGDVGT